jgi:hypothetical protein
MIWVPQTHFFWSLHCFSQFIVQDLRKTLLFRNQLAVKQAGARLKVTWLADKISLLILNICPYWYWRYVPIDMFRVYKSNHFPKIWFKMIWDLIFMDILKIKSQIKSAYFNMILKISKSSQNDLKSDLLKSSIKSLNTLDMLINQYAVCSPPEWHGAPHGNVFFLLCPCQQLIESRLNYSSPRRTNYTQVLHACIVID